METTIVEGLRTLKFDLVFTLALAALFLFIGYAIQRRVPVLARSSIPAPAIGGLLFALIILMLRVRGVLGINIDTSLRAPLQTAFFTTIGLSATISLLRAGGWRMAFFWLIASVTAIVQTIVGIGMARAMNAPALLGIICGALTLTGGPATGLAFADTFERAGITGASSLIIASATFGIFIASLVGNPTATALIRRFRLASSLETDNKRPQGEGLLAKRRNDAENHNEEEAKTRNAEDKEILNASARHRVDTLPLTSRVLLQHLLLILGIMGVGALIGLGLTYLRVTLPGYVGAMVVASIVRNVDDRTGWFKINMRAVEAFALIALALFLVIALMDLKLWQLAGLAVPMLIILVVQVVLMIAYAVLVTFILMGRDYEAAVTASGHIGFGLGITPNAVANMEALVERYKPAPQSFLIVPVVGAFFIDFSNALIITLFINLVR
ncbi:MAG: sodium/glutamate symporter [Acidobacteria bacterium]|nr:sodium/glutamate symporter [Acidobacteriota bacterium]